MSINIKTDPLRSAILFGRPVLFASQRIPREEVPESWYYYELRGSVRNAKKPVALSDHAYVNPIGSVLSPVPLKRADTISRRVNGQFLLLGETTGLLLEQRSGISLSNSNICRPARFARGSGHFLCPDA